MEKARKTIAQLVRDNYIVASVLHFFGIHFYEHTDKTLEQVCSEHAVSAEIVKNRLETAGELPLSQLSLIDYPVELVIGYLRHAHHIFIKEKLPYMAHIIKHIRPNSFSDAQIALDLQSVFPIFTEDFIRHIYEEEDHLFSYILKLSEAKRNIKPTQLYFTMEQNSIQKFSMEHEAYDDEMAGIRAMTDDYYLPPTADLHQRVVYSELIGFEKALQIHASIENRILFPKALQLEQEIKSLMQTKIRLN